MEKELQKRIFTSIIIIPLSLFFIIKGSFFFIFFLTIIFFVSLNEWLKIAKKNELKILGIFFLLFSLYSSYYFRDKEGLENFLLIITICISTDLGGYIFGKLLKGPKLIKISPKKTYTGMIGGFLLSIIFSYLFILIYKPSLIITNDIIFIMFVILISLISQIGDLIISYFKRSSKIKNTGKILPGHGGILDRVDGMIFVFPFVFTISILL